MLGGRRAIDRDVPSFLELMIQGDAEGVEQTTAPPASAAAAGSAPPTTSATAPVPSATSQESHPENATDKSTASSSPKKSIMPSIRLLSADVERDSQKVRSLYEPGDDLDWRERPELIAW